MSGSYTDLQKQEIGKLTARIREMHAPTKKNIGPITTDMVQLLYHDDEMKSVYNKKTIIIGSLCELFTRSDEKQTEDNIRTIVRYEPYIDRQIHEQNLSAKKDTSCCRRSFTYTCGIS